MVSESCPSHLAKCTRYYPSAHRRRHKQEREVRFREPAAALLRFPSARSGRCRSSPNRIAAREWEDFALRKRGSFSPSRGRSPFSGEPCRLFPPPSAENEADDTSLLGRGQAIRGPADRTAPAARNLLPNPDSSPACLNFQRASNSRPRVQSGFPNPSFPSRIASYSVGDTSTMIDGYSMP